MLEKIRQVTKGTRTRFLGIFVLLLALPLAVYMVMRGTGMKGPTEAFTRFVGITFSQLFFKTPPNDISVVLQLNVEEKVTFARVEIEFDTQVLQLSDEVQVDGPLKRAIEITPKEFANQDMGHVVIALGLDPADLDNPPTGLINLATLKFVPATNSVNRSAKIYIKKTDLAGNLTTQVVDLRNNDIAYLFGFGTEKINIAINPQVDSSTLRACSFKSSFGAKGSGPQQFDSPASIAVYPVGLTDEDKSIYVADTQNHRIQVFDYSGNFLTESGTYGSGEGELDTPGGIARGHYNVFVADTNNNRIQIYDDYQSKLYLVNSVGFYGKDLGQFDHPEDVTAAGSVMYVADTDNDRVQKIVYDAFANKVIEIESWGSVGEEDGQFVQPYSIAVDKQLIYKDGNVYVADSTNRIQRFTHNGNFINSFGVSGTGEGEFVGPLDVSVDASSIVHVFDAGRNKVLRFTSNGIFLNEWGAPGSGEAEFKGALGVAAENGNNDLGNIFIADTENNRIQRFNCSSSECVFERAFGSEGINDGQFKNMSGLTVDREGIVYVSDYVPNTEIGRVQKFDSEGNFIGKWNSDGSDNAGFFFSYLDSDSENNIYLTDSSSSKIVKFDNQGNYITSWTIEGTEAYKFPQGIALDQNNNVYVSIYGTSPKLQKYDSSGNFIQEWGSEGVFDGQFAYTRGVDVSNNGHIYIAEGSRVQKFDSDSNFITWFGGSGDPNGYNIFHEFLGPAHGYFQNPEDVAVDNAGNIYVSDSSKNRIQEFNKDGIFKSEIAMWNGQSGSGNGEFWIPKALAFHPADNILYVADTGNHRVQKFVCPSAPVSTPSPTQTPTSPMATLTSSVVFPDEIFSDHGIKNDWEPPTNGTSSLFIWDGECKSFSGGYDPGDLLWSTPTTDKTTHTYRSTSIQPGNTYCSQIWTDFYNDVPGSNQSKIAIPTPTLTLTPTATPTPSPTPTPTATVTPDPELGYCTCVKSRVRVNRCNYPYKAVCISPDDCICQSSQ